MATHNNIIPLILSLILAMTFTFRAIYQIVRLAIGKILAIDAVFSCGISILFWAGFYFISN